MLSRIKNWFTPSRKYINLQPATKFTNIDSKTLDGNLRIEALLDMEGMEAFLATDDVKVQTEVLNRHSFWQRDEPMFDLDAKTYVQVLRYIVDVNEFYQTYESESEKALLQNIKGVAWGNPQKFIKWQQQACILAQQEPMHAGALLDLVQKQLLLNANNRNKQWPRQAEHFLSNGGKFSAEQVFSSLNKLDLKDVSASIAKAPVIAKFWDEPQYDSAALQWAGQDTSKLLWLTRQHSRMSSWTAAEQLNDKSGIGKLAAIAHDSALLKAWHGLPLTSEEIASHPLAYSLYVHKYAPVYIEEARPLPDTWSIALSLCATGVDFNNMLLLAAKAKLSPQSQSDDFILPDLECAP